MNVLKLLPVLLCLHSIASGQRYTNLKKLTEFSCGTLPDSTWWTKIILPAVGMHKISYTPGWRNTGKSPQGRYAFYVPYKGAVPVPDFVQFYNDRKTLFQKDMAKENLYQ